MRPPRQHHTIEAVPKSVISEQQRLFFSVVNIPLMQNGDAAVRVLYLQTSPARTGRKNRGKEEPLSIEAKPRIELRDLETFFGYRSLHLAQRVIVRVLK
jgi:alanine-alpha-ketoisovalerate/valine-pyruvate aminotransferase